MSLVYHRTFYVPLWVIIEECKNKSKVIKWLTENDALGVPWPSLTFKDTAESFRSRGWSEYLDSEIALPVEFVMRAAVEHVQKTNPTAQLIPYKTLTGINRRDKTKEGYTNIFDELLLSCEPINLSQIFMVQEKAHHPNRESFKVWFTEDPCNKKVLTMISNKVITVGERDGVDINVEGLSKNELNQTLEEKLGETLKQILNKTN